MIVTKPLTAKSLKIMQAAYLKSRIILADRERRKQNAGKK
jgi:hypothetical protein